MNGAMSLRGPSIVARSRHPAASAPPSPGPESPPAVRSTRTRWGDPRLVVGLAVVTLCAVLGARALASADDTVAVWAAGASLEAGQHIGPGDVVRRQIRFGDQADADRYLSAESALPRVSTLDRSVDAGELVPRSALGHAPAGPRTEVPLSVSSEAVPATVRLGSTVDVWVTPKSAGAVGKAGGAAVPRSTLVFHDVPVVSVPRTGSSLGPTATRQVIVGIAAGQQAQLPRSIAVLASGDVVLTVKR